MLKYNKISLLIFLTFFIVEYEGYNWNPCSGDWCLLVNCPGGTCRVDGEIYFVNTIQEAQEILNKNGIEYLHKVYRVDWEPLTQHAKVFELTVVPSYSIQDTSQLTWDDTITTKTK